MFFDLETTGLSGGAGTLAFLVGCAWFERDGAFVTRQFLLARHADERPLLKAVAAELARAGALVSFNGKSFDAPLLEGRYLFHRLGWRGREMPHVDVLHPARRFWKPRAAALTITYFDVDIQDHEGCSLQSLERQIVGARRHGDVPGFEIPARYFQFIRSGDARPLTAVLEHNRLDLLTLAALTARLLHMARSGPEALADPREALALGHVYAARRARGARPRELPPRHRALPVAARRLRPDPRSRRCARSRSRAGAPGSTRKPPPVGKSWSRCAAARRRSSREAAEALAIHHEHRVPDLALAKTFALGSLAAAAHGPRPSIAQAVRHRLARLERKMGEAGSLSEVKAGPKRTRPTRFYSGRGGGASSSPWSPSRRSCGSPTSARRTSW